VGVGLFVLVHLKPLHCLFNLIAWLILHNLSPVILFASATVLKLSIYLPSNVYLFNFPVSLVIVTYTLSSFSVVIKYPFTLFESLIALVRFPLSVSKKATHSALVLNSFTKSPS
jgi:hypothetical protein